MKYDLSKESDIYLFSNQVEWLLANKKLCELDVIKTKRTITQNKALHLYFEFISNELNELGIVFYYTGLKGLTMETRFTPLVVKEFIIKPIINTLFNVDSTTKLDTKMINEVIDVVNKFMSDKGVYIPFPSIQSLIDKQR